MSMHDDLKKVLDNIVMEDEAAAKDAFSAYIVAKTSAMLREAKKEKSPFRLDGEDLFVNDKKVGTVKNDVDGEKGLSYTSNEGKKKKFEKIADLYAHVGKECKLTEVKDYESDVQGMPNHGPKLTDEKPFENPEEEGAEGNKADKKLAAKPKKLIADINAGKRPTKD